MTMTMIVSCGVTKKRLVNQLVKVPIQTTMNLLPSPLVVVPKGATTTRMMGPLARHHSAHLLLRQKSRRWIRERNEKLIPCGVGCNRANRIPMIPRLLPRPIPPCAAILPTFRRRWHSNNNMPPPCRYPPRKKIDGDWYRDGEEEEGIDTNRFVVPCHFPPLDDRQHRWTTTMVTCCIPPSDACRRMTSLPTCWSA